MAVGFWVTAGEVLRGAGCWCHLRQHCRLWQHRLRWPDSHPDRQVRQQLAVEKEGHLDGR